MPVCVNDNIKFALNFYNLSGLVDLGSVEWKSPIIEAIPAIPKELHSNFLQGIDKNRICEMEEIHDEWYLYKYFENRNKTQYEGFDPQLVLQETKCAGVDRITMKTQYLANAKGIIENIMDEVILIR